jgi:hypothetical protein
MKGDNLVKTGRHTTVAQKQGENSKMGDNLYQSNIFKNIIQSLVRKKLGYLNLKRINIELG